MLISTISVFPVSLFQFVPESRKIEGLFPTSNFPPLESHSMYKFSIALLCVAVSFVSAGHTVADDSPDVVYVPTPNDVVSKMLKAAKLKKTDVVYDLGCGDGRIVVTAARTSSVTVL